MIFATFFKSSWNIVLSLSLTLSMMIIGFVIPPKFSTNLIEYTIDFSLFSKFILGVFITLFLVPIAIFNKPKHKLFWCFFSIILLISGFFCFARYYTIINSRTIVYGNERVVIGNTLSKSVQYQVDSIEHQKKMKLTNQDILLLATGDLNVWALEERQNNSLTIIFMHLITLSIFSLAALSAIQALYCTLSSIDIQEIIKTVPK
jgi:hypothetical protein